MLEVERTPRPTFDSEEELRREDGEDSFFSASDAENKLVSQPAATTSDYSGDVTLGQFILDRVGDAVKGLFRHSQTILRVDLRQALRYDVPLRGRKSTEVVTRARGTSASVPQRRAAAAAEPVAQEQLPWSHGLQGGGARLKLMQVFLP